MRILIPFVAAVVVAPHGGSALRSPRSPSPPPTPSSPFSTTSAFTRSLQEWRYARRWQQDSRHGQLSATSDGAHEAAASDAVVFHRIASGRWANTRAEFNASRTVSPEIVRSLLNSAATAPSGFNTQPYVAVVVQQGEQRQKLAKAMLGSNALKVLRAPVCVVWCADLESSRLIPKLLNITRDVPLHGRLPSARSLRMVHIYQRLFAGGHRLALFRPLVFLAKKIALGIASHVLRIATPTIGSCETWAVKNTMLAAQTYLLAATSHGLSSCPMEGYDGRRVRKALGIPRRYSIPLVVATGYANDGVEPVATKRFDQAEVFFDGQFGVPFPPAST